MTLPICIFLPIVLDAWKLASHTSVLNPQHLSITIAASTFHMQMLLSVSAQAFSSDQNLSQMKIGTQCRQKRFPKHFIPAHVQKRPVFLPFVEVFVYPQDAHFLARATSPSLFKSLVYPTLPHFTGYTFLFSWNNVAVFKQKIKRALATVQLLLKQCQHCRDSLPPCLFTKLRTEQELCAMMQLCLASFQWENSRQTNVSHRIIICHNLWISIP